MLSIALATYNGEKYIREQLDSILMQTVTDWELVACDDCSSDGTFRILREYAEKDDRIRVFRNETNLGFRRNFEKAVSLTSGDYVALCDQDDVWYPDHLERLLGIMGDCSLACGNAELVDGAGRSMGVTLDRAQHFRWTEGNYLYMLLLRGCKFQGASMLLEGEFARKCVPIPDGVYAHDMWFAACACMEDGLRYSTECVTKYRRHGDNETGQSHSIFILSLLGQFLCGKGIRTDAFAFHDGLKGRYGLGNGDFREISRVMGRIRQKKMTFSDVRFLWKHYYDIGGKRTRLDFLPALAVWAAWKERGKDEGQA